MTSQDQETEDRLGRILSICQHQRHDRELPLRGELLYSRLLLLISIESLLPNQCNGIVFIIDQGIELREGFFCQRTRDYRSLRATIEDDRTTVRDNIATVSPQTKLIYQGQMRSCRSISQQSDSQSILLLCFYQSFLIFDSDLELAIE